MANDLWYTYPSYSEWPIIHISQLGRIAYDKYTAAMANDLREYDKHMDNGQQMLMIQFLITRMKWKVDTGWEWRHRNTCIYL